jgi:hypothetical protein
VTQAFGARPEVYAQYGFPGHEGIDLAAALNAPVRAVASGHISKVTTAGNYGNRTNVMHDDGWETVYAHLNSFEGLPTGTPVAAGQVIGYAGSTGNSTGTHLHFGLKRAGFTYTDPSGTIWPFNIHDPSPYLAPFIPASNTVDMLPYLRGDGRLYEIRHPTGQTETFQTQAEGDWFYQCKNSQWEQLYADAEYIWRGADTSPGGGRFYVQFEPGKARARWMPRRMSIGQTWVGPGHFVQFFMKSDCSKSVLNSGNATNRMTFQAYYKKLTWNGVTVDDVVELTNGNEVWWFARGFGLVAWKSSWGESAIVQVYAPGERPALVREKLCSYQL